MKHLFIIILSFFTLNLSAQTWCGGCAECEFITPAPAYDSVFVLISDSGNGVAHCRGSWESILDVHLFAYDEYTATWGMSDDAHPTVGTVLYNSFDQTITVERSGEGTYQLTFSPTSIDGGAQIQAQITGFNTPVVWSAQPNISGIELKTYDAAFSSADVVDDVVITLKVWNP
jgi:hypothetical protein